MLVLDKQDFAHATATIARFLPTRPAVPALLGTRLTLERGRLLITGYDYTTGTALTLDPLSAEGDLDIAVPGRILADLVAKAPGRDVRVELDGTTAQISSGRARYSIQTIAELVDVPSLPEPTVTVDTEELLHAVKRVAPAASTDQRAPIFTAILMSVVDGGLVLTATDRYRIAQARIPVSGDLEETPIPARTLLDAVKAATSDTIGLGAGQGLVGIDAGMLRMGVASLGGDFPKVAHFLDKLVSPVEITADRAELLAAVTRIGMAAERNSPIILTPEGGSLRLQAATGESLQAEETIDAQGVSGPEMRYNPTYLRDALTCVGGENVRIAGAPTKPTLITGEDASAYRHVVMGMRGPA